MANLFAGLGRLFGGTNPLYKAAQEKDLSKVRWLVQQHPGDVNVQEQQMGWTPLHVSAFQGSDAIVRELLARGARHNITDKEGRTPLHLAVMQGHAQATQDLLRRGAATGARDKGGLAPHDYAAQRHPALLPLLGPPPPGLAQPAAPSSSGPSGSELSTGSFGLAAPPATVPPAPIGAAGGAAGGVSFPRVQHSGVVPAAAAAGPGAAAAAAPLQRTQTPPGQARPGAWGAAAGVYEAAGPSAPAAAGGGLYTYPTYPQGPAAAQPPTAPAGGGQPLSFPQHGSYQPMSPQHKPSAQQATAGAAAAPLPYPSFHSQQPSAPSAPTPPPAPSPPPQQQHASSHPVPQAPPAPPAPPPAPPRQSGGGGWGGGGGGVSGGGSGGGPDAASRGRPPPVSAAADDEDDWGTGGPSDWGGDDEPPSPARPGPSGSGAGAATPPPPASMPSPSFNRRPGFNPIMSARFQLEKLLGAGLSHLGLGGPHPHGPGSGPGPGPGPGWHPSAPSASGAGPSGAGSVPPSPFPAGPGYGLTPMPSDSAQSAVSIASTTRSGPAAVGGRLYSYEELRVATGGFSPINKLGEGGFGPVYRGALDGIPVAVKVMDASEGALQGRSEFEAEVSILSALHHPHVVLLIGSCPEKGMLVYELMSNASLEAHLLGPGRAHAGPGPHPAKPPLGWRDRVRIAAEMASALLFLHSASPPIVHMDLKPANILLDDHLTSKLGDVGLARLAPSLARPAGPAGEAAAARAGVGAAKSTVKDSRLVGTFEYIDPEYLHTGEFSTKSDVYAMGMVLLQLLTGKDTAQAAHAAVRAARAEPLGVGPCLDPRAGPWPAAEALAFADLALRCAEYRRQDRPDLRSVVLPTLMQLKQRTLLYDPPPPAPAAAAPAAQQQQQQQAGAAGGPGEAEAVPPMFLCPITQDIMDEPVVAADGYTYERLAITEWITRSQTSPMTGVRLSHTQVVDNLTLRSAIKEWEEQQQRRQQKLQAAGGAGGGSALVQQPVGGAQGPSAPPMPAGAKYPELGGWYADAQAKVDAICQRLIRCCTTQLTAAAESSVYPRACPLALDDAGVAPWLLKRLRGLAAKASGVSFATNNAANLLITAASCEMEARAAGVLLRLLVAAATVCCPADDCADQYAWGRALLSRECLLTVTAAMTGNAHLAATLARTDVRDALTRRLRATAALCTHEATATATANTAASFLATCSQLAVLMCQRLESQLELTSDAPPATAVDLAEAMAGSGLLASLAEAILKCPQPQSRPRAARKGARALEALSLLHSASSTACAAIHTLHTSYNRLSRSAKSPAGSSLLTACGAVLLHPAMKALTHAQLERLWVHAGMEPQGGAEAGTGTGLRWWLPLLEAETGRVLGLGQASDGDMCAPLESYHYLVAITALSVRRLRLWSKLRTAGVAPATPMAARLAQVSARTAEALCRLCRGEGLGGGYGAGLSWQAARIPDFTSVLVSPLGGMTASGLLPAWLEAAGWTLGMCVEAAEAELEGSARPPVPYLAHAHCVEPAGGPAAGVQEALRTLACLPRPPVHIDVSCPAVRAAYMHASARLHAANVWASLDHSLRLAITSVHRARRADGPTDLPLTAQRLGGCATLIGGAVTLLPVQPAAVDSSQPWLAPDPVGGGEAAGWMTTFGKLVAACLRRLQTLAAKGTPEGRAGQLDLVQAESCVLLVNLALVLDHLPRLGGVQRGGGVAAAGSAAHEVGEALGGGTMASEAALYTLRTACLVAAHAAELATSAPLSAAAEVDGIVPAALLRRCLLAVTRACRGPGALSASQLLSLQPHRLLAAACKLLYWHTPRDGGGATWGDGEWGDLSELCTQLLGALIALAAHPVLSDRVRVWLTPAGKAAAANAGPEAAGTGTAGEAEAGCLEALLRCGVVPRALALCGDAVVWAQLLLLVARGGSNSSSGFHSAARAVEEADWSGRQMARPCGKGTPAQREGNCGDSACPPCGEGSSAFRQVASTLDLWLQLQTHSADLQLGSLSASRLLSLYKEYLQAQTDASGKSAEDDEADLAALVAAPLPPPLAAPLALPRLRVCGHPGCKSFGGRCEAELPLLLCAGCRCVCYCCHEHQRQHWRREHKR